MLLATTENRIAEGQNTEKMQDCKSNFVMKIAEIDFDKNEENSRIFERRRGVRVVR